MHCITVYLDFMLIAMVLLCSLPQTAAQGPCNNEVLTQYDIGASTTLLSIDAEMVSSLQQPCYKEIQVDRALKMEIGVDAAEFSYNKYYEYGGLNGVTLARAYDGISMIPGACQAAGEHSNEMIPIKTGLISRVNGSVVCFKFEPELERRNLGGHMPGGRIVIKVTVNLALCANVTVGNAGNCKPMCSAGGPLHNCHKTGTTAPQIIQNTYPPSLMTSLPSLSTSTPITNKPKPSNTTAFISTSFTTRIPATHPPTSSSPYTVSTARGQTNRQSITSPIVSKSSTLLPSTLIPPTVSNPGITAQNRSTEQPSASTDENHVTSEKSHMAMSTKTNTSPLLTSLTTTGTSTSTGDTTTDGSPPYATTIHTTRYHASATTIKTVGATKTANNSKEQIDHTEGSDKLFGLVEGLYVVGGCIVILLILAITICLVKKRHHRCFEPARLSTSTKFSDYVTTSTLQWRDNWLVRYYHNSIHDVHGDIHDDSFDFSDEGSDSFGPNYHHGTVQSSAKSDNDQCNSILSDEPQAIREHDNGNDQDAYEDPWPLVRLSSDFVRNTKSLSRKDSDVNRGDFDGKTVGNHEDALVSTQRNEPTGDQLDDCALPGLPYSGSFESQKTSDGNVLPRNSKYSIRRVQRSSSKSDASSNSYTKHTFGHNQSNGGQNSHGKDRANSRRKGSKMSQRSSSMKSVVAHTDNTCYTIQRDRHSSKTHSDDSAIFDEIIKDEIENIENAIGIEGAIDLESSGDQPSNNPSTKDRKGWRVSALYAIVSSKESTHDHGADHSATGNSGKNDRRNITTRMSSRAEKRGVRRWSSKTKHSGSGDASQDGNREEDTMNQLTLSTETTIAKMPKETTNSKENFVEIELNEPESASPQPPTTVHVAPKLPMRNPSSHVIPKTLTQPFKVKHCSASGTVQFGK